MDFVSLKADPDVWIRLAIKPDGKHIYKYVLVYINSVLAIGIDPQGILSKLESKYTLKPSLIKRPDQYLGAQIKEWRIEGSDNPTKVWWAISPRNTSGTQ